MMIRFRRLALFALLFIATGARGEFLVSEARPNAPMLGESGNVRVEATRSGFLAFWATTGAWRSVPPGVFLTGVPTQLQVARLSRAGALERRETLSGLPSGFYWYDAASDGDQVLLAGVCYDAPTRPLCMVRFSAAGDLLSFTTVPVSEVVAPTVTSNGDGFLVTFSVASSQRRVFAVPVARDGTPGSPIDLGAWDPNSQWTSPAAIDGTYFGAWGAPGAHVLARLSSSGVEASVPLDPPFTISQVRIEASGGRLLVVTTPRAPASLPDSRMRAAIFDRDLQRLTEWMPLEGGASLPRLAATAEGWIVAAEGYNNYNEATLLPVSLSGDQGTFVRIAGVRGFVIDAAARGDRAAVVWRDPSDLTVPDFPHNRARIAIFEADATPVSEPSTISVGPAPQVHPAAAHANGVTLAAWSERTPDGGWRVKARPFDATGLPLAPAISMPHRGAPQMRPAVATDGSSFYLAWSEGPGGSSGAYGIRVGANETLLDPYSTLLFGATGIGSEWYRTVAVAWSGSSWITVSTNDLRDLVAVRVSPGGVVLDPAPRTIAPPEEINVGTHFGPVVDCSGSECLVVWHGPSVPTPGCQITCPLPPPGLYAAIIGPDLETLRRLPALTEAWEELPYDFRTLDATWNGIAREWLVSWTRHQRITPDGVLLVPPEAVSGSGSRGSSSVPERDGWRIVWWPSGTPDIYHGWTKTGAIGQIGERSVLAASEDAEWDPRAVDAPRPLALFLRESFENAGSPEVVGRFFDESPPAENRTLLLSATRLPGGDVRLDWTTDLEDVTGFWWSILRHGEWVGGGSIEPSVRHTFLTPGTMTDVTHIVLGASTPSGPVYSNVVDVVRPRGRVVRRQ